MASSKTKTIDEIDDISEMAEAMTALGMSCKGLKTLDDMKEKVRDEFHQSLKKPRWNAGQVRTSAATTNVFDCRDLKNR